MYGAILAVWSSGISLSKIDMPDDLLLDRPLTESQFVEYAKSFEADLAAFVSREREQPGDYD